MVLLGMSTLLYLQLAQSGLGIPVFQTSNPVPPSMSQPVVALISAWATEPARSGRLTSGLTLASFGPLSFSTPGLPRRMAGKVPAATPVDRPTKKEIEDTLCDVMASGSSLSGVISMLSITTKANIVALSSSDLPITLSLRQVKFKEALQIVLSIVGMKYLKVGNAFIVGAEDRLKATYPGEWEKANPAPTTGQEPNKTAPETAPVDPVITKTHALSYAVPAQMVESLKMLFEGKGLNVVVGPASSAPTLTDRDASNSTGVTAGVITSAAKPGGKTLLLRGPKSVVEDAIEAAKSLDIQRAQVLIEVSILDVSDGALKELGVNWNIGGTTFTETDPKGVNFGSITRTPFNFGAAIKALETSDKAKILASPSVRVLDEERAFVLIGNRLTLPKFDGYDANRIPIYSTSEYRVGIYLQVAPSISADGTITMAIYPQVSTIVKFTEINGGSYPDIATREAQTTLRVKSGESIVLGGLLKNDEIEQMERIPILSKIPILGELFTRRKKTKGSSQVVISLTPTLIKGD